AEALLVQVLTHDEKAAAIVHEAVQHDDRNVVIALLRLFERLQAFTEDAERISNQQRGEAFGFGSEPLGDAHGPAADFGDNTHAGNTLLRQVTASTPFSVCGIRECLFAARAKRPARLRARRA